MTSAERDRERCSHRDPGLIDELKCRAAGIKAQAAYNDEQAPGLDDARTRFETARTDYNSARGDAAPKVDKAREDLEGLHDRIRCMLDRDDAECIDIAFGRVIERLDRCGHGRGCCCDGDCDYDDVRDIDYDDVPGRKAVIERRTKEAQECFWTLIGEYTVVTSGTAAPGGEPAAAADTEPAGAATTPEPAAGAASEADAAAQAPADGAAQAKLAARVTDLQNEIAKIAKAATDGSWLPSKLYAAVLVARRHLKDVWAGFADVNEYMECLCQALTCTVKGHAAISELTRREAEHHCYRASWQAGCEHLAQHTVEEVLAEYLRVCVPCDEDKPEGPRRRPRDRDEDNDGRRDDDRNRDGDAGRTGERRRDDDRDDRNHADDRGDERSEQRPPRPRGRDGRYYREQ
jgi:hypothetical protein